MILTIPPSDSNTLSDPNAWGSLKRRAKSLELDGLSHPAEKKQKWEPTTKNQHESTADEKQPLRQKRKWSLALPVDSGSSSSLPASPPGSIMTLELGHHDSPNERSMKRACLITPLQYKDSEETEITKAANTSISTPKAVPLPISPAATIPILTPIAAPTQLPELHVLTPTTPKNPVRGGTLNSKAFMRKEVHIGSRQQRRKTKTTRQERRIDSSPSERAAWAAAERRQAVGRGAGRKSAQVAATPRKTVLPLKSPKFVGNHVVLETPIAPLRFVFDFGETTRDPIKKPTDALELKVNALECGITAILAELRSLSRKLELVTKSIGQEV